MGATVGNRKLGRITNTKKEPSRHGAALVFFIVIFVQTSHIVIIDIAFWANFGSKFFMGFIDSSIFIFSFDHML